MLAKRIAYETRSVSAGFVEELSGFEGVWPTEFARFLRLTTIYAMPFMLPSKTAN
ncbi:hypothetical protein RBSWK_02918 [Rhodopirellula baltica SWK14]|uniref:Uncharacterized protein n=1 Tax=Rhodopirellula baltica SWK14 TaxID=993516 RepID=L7CHH7_RHOBT|nr:hypothetical protein RBSWK_02918 [Rhodopirellula baltica SWK14]